MIRQMNCVLFALLSIGVTNGAETGDVLKPGSWKKLGRRSMIGNQWKRIVTLVKNDRQWSISFIFVEYGNNGSRKSTRGPFPIKIKDGIITSEEHGKTVDYTFCVDGNDLVLPAFIKTDERTWCIKSPQYNGLISCEFDPVKVPVGTAEFPQAFFVGRQDGDVRRTQGFYVYEPVPAQPDGVTQARQLRFMTRRYDGLATEEYRLVWGSNQSPSFSAQGPEHSAEIRHEPIGSEELLQIEKLPENTAPSIGDKSSN